MPPKLPLIERTNALPLSTFHSLYFPQTYPSLTHITPKSGTSYQISLHTHDNIDIPSCFNLIAATSLSNYASSSVGWHPKSKRKEMLLPDLKYLTVTPIQSPAAPPKGFLSFMCTYEDGKEVIYVYELHLTEDVRGGGLGKQLMELVEDVGRKVGVEKVMLTVFVANVGAWKFYKKLGYEVDEFSPEPRRLRGGVVKEPDYVILSKGLRGKTEAQVTATNES
jgi:predicted GNAT family acetyltransferase